MIFQYHKKYLEHCKIMNYNIIETGRENSESVLDVAGLLKSRYTMKIATF